MGWRTFRKHAVWGWRQLPVPVIAAIQGVAFGGGFQLALGADMRFLTPDARMSIMEIKWGLVPDMAGTPILASLVRDDILRELTYTGRIFSAQEAMSYGLATRICDDPLAAAFEVAREIAGKSPGCDPRRQAHAQQTVGRSRLRRCSPNPSSSRNCSAAPTRPRPCAPTWKSARPDLRRRANSSS